MAEMTVADYWHIQRVNTEVKWWANSYNETWDNAVRERILPPYLLTAYIQDIFDHYWGYDKYYQFYVRGGLGAKSTKKLILETLNIIADTVMRPDFDDMELRMQIMRMYHDAGYQTAAQVKLEL